MRLATLGFLLLPLLAPAITEAQAVQGSSSARLLMGAAAKGPLRPPVLADTTDSIPRRIRPTHWKEGALIGGLALGTTFALLAPGFCALGDRGSSDCGGAAVAGFLGGAVLGGLIGALVGGQFPKEEQAANPETPE